MNISDLIRELHLLKHAYGDIQVVMNGNNDLLVKPKLIVRECVGIDEIWHHRLFIDFEGSLK